MNGRRNENEYHGLLVLDKPGGMTSREAINRIQRLLPRGTKVGHTGTLDPLATGVLVVCLGHATRLAEYVQAMPKTYRSTFRLGATSDTDDADGTITHRPGAQPVEPSAIDIALRQFIGEIEQTPPAYSAAKVGGQRAYDLAREGSEVDLRSRRVVIDCIDVVSYAWPRVEVEVRCGKGTYIRALARDLGTRLGCGALVEMLRRVSVGPFTVEQAISVDAMLEIIRERLQSMNEAVNWMGQVTVSEADAERLRRGQAIRAQSERVSAVCDQSGQLVAICRPDDTGQWLRPVKVLPRP